MSDIEIRALRTLDEMRAVVDLQKVYWGIDLESVIPAHMLYSIANHGGHVLAAFDQKRMVGVLVGFLGTGTEETTRPAMTNLQIVSKRMVVLPEYRNRSIGYRLKLAQRDLAVKHGVRLVTWTFDPMLSTNAHLNVRKLGVMCQTYLENYYGTSAEGGLAILGYSDRLQADWWVTNRRVEERLFGKRGGLALKQYLEAETMILNPTLLSGDGLVLPAEQVYAASGSLVLLEIPANYLNLVKKNETLARTWRLHTRGLFEQLFATGYIVTDFIHEPHEGRDRAFYLLAYNGSQFDASTLN